MDQSDVFIFITRCAGQGAATLESFLWKFLARFADEGTRTLTEPIEAAEVERASTALEATAMVAGALVPPAEEDRASNPNLHLSLSTHDAVSPPGRRKGLVYTRMYTRMCTRKCRIYTRTQ